MIGPRTDLGAPDGMSPRDVSLRLHIAEDDPAAVATRGQGYHRLSACAREACDYRSEITDAISILASTGAPARERSAAVNPCPMVGTRDG